MGEKWYEGLSDESFKTETAKLYESASNKIREGLAQGLDFDSACSAIDVADKKLRQEVIDDMLKVLIAEEHFTNGITLSELALKLKVHLDRLESAKMAMLDEVKNESIRAFYNSTRPGNA